jgi:hypothetical protein
MVDYRKLVCKRCLEQKGNKMSISLATVKGVLNNVGNTMSPDFDVLGITADDMNLLRQQSQWMVAHKRQVIGALDALIYSSVDAVGLNRYELPAEYIAAIIGAFVAPANVQIACSWLEQHAKTGKPIHDLANGYDAESLPSVRAPQLFALVKLAEGEAEVARQKFDSRVQELTEVVSDEA